LRARHLHWDDAILMTQSAYTINFYGKSKAIVVVSNEQTQEILGYWRVNVDDEKTVEGQAVPCG